MRRLLLLALLLAAGCHEQRQGSAPPPQRQAEVPHVTAPTRSAVAPPEAKRASADASGAADMLRHYYALIEAGRYGDAWRMRSGGNSLDEAAFEAHFKAYETYHSQVGTPSEPVASRGWIWVEVPVMTTGRFLGGKPFGSAGSVTLRRRSPGNKAAGDHGWQIYTGDSVCGSGCRRWLY